MSPRKGADVGDLVVPQEASSTNSAEEEGVCSECDGEGFVELDVSHLCSKPISVCCGGCTRKVPCTECNPYADEDYYDDEGPEFDKYEYEDRSRYMNENYGGDED